MRRRWQLLILGVLALALTCLGICIAFANHIEESPYAAERLAIGTVAACNLVWFIPWTIIQRRRNDRTMLRMGVLLFAICWLHFPFRFFHHPGFVAETWKNSFDYSYSIEGLYPAHRAGYMVPDIISSEVCVGKTRTEIEGMLGTHYFPYQGCSCDTCIGYFYAGSLLFDGCDKLMLCFVNDTCRSACHAGCD